MTLRQGVSKVRNGVLIRFSADAGRMIIRYFPAYYPFPKDRAAFVSTVVGRGLL